ncbi:efflux RND transporter periplasmic adaptor subunit [Flammeovirgaceae bacterium SG7u.111]|nr:efflux RND transporter periplasmic adaptor subunit [Flammeovirgaceae bacterium SG7u.132]WPO38518.1 efflux RND transporter periplasmic adaptor subunit [Flammeovirgaceae bacterium SG7u.111]
MAKKKSNTKIYIILGSLLVLVVLAGFIGRKQGWIGGEKAKKVVFGKVKRETIVEKVSASGRVQPENEVRISPLVPGEIDEIYIEEGDSVVAGQLLLKIKPDNLRSALDRSIAALNTQKANYAQSQARLSQAKARFINSELTFKRNKSLFDEKVISEQEYEQSLADFEVSKAELEAAEKSVESSMFTVKSAEATVKEAKENLGFTEIYAPMGGIITKLLVEKGERVVGTQQMSGTELLRVANLNVMEVRVNVNENDIIRVNEGDTAIIDVDSYSFLEAEFKGVVTAIANSANEGVNGLSTDAVTEFEVKIRILRDSYRSLSQNKKEDTFSPTINPFRPGMTASVDIITARKAGALSVPLASVTTRKIEMKEGEEKKKAAKDDDDMKEVVFLHLGDSVMQVEVVTGISDFENIEILEGLEEDQEIVKGPFLQVSKTLKNGDKVERMEDRKPGGKGPKVD